MTQKQKPTVYRRKAFRKSGKRVGDEICSRDNNDQDI